MSVAPPSVVVSLSDSLPIPPSDSLPIPSVDVSLSDSLPVVPSPPPVIPACSRVTVAPSTVPGRFRRSRSARTFRRRRFRPRLVLGSVFRVVLRFVPPGPLSAQPASTIALAVPAAVTNDRRVSLLRDINLIERSGWFRCGLLLHPVNTLLRDTILSISVIYIGTVTVQTTSRYGAQERDWTVGRPISKPNSELWFKTDNSSERRHCRIHRVPSPVGSRRTIEASVDAVMSSPVQFGGPFCAPVVVTRMKIRASASARSVRLAGRTTRPAAWAVLPAGVCAASGSTNVPNTPTCRWRSISHPFGTRSTRSEPTTLPSGPVIAVASTCAAADSSTPAPLRELDDTYLAAIELLHVADIVAREIRLEDREELYFLSLLRDADQSERPPAEDVPRSLRAARWLAYANAVRGVPPRRPDLGRRPGTDRERTERARDPRRTRHAHPDARRRRRSADRRTTRHGDARPGKWPPRRRARARRPKSDWTASSNSTVRSARGPESWSTGSAPAANCSQPFLR